MWNIKFVIRATRIVTDGLKKNLEWIPGKHTVDSLQETTMLGTSHIMQKALVSDTWSLRREKYVGEKACDKRQLNNHSDDDGDKEEEEEEEHVVHLVGC